MWAEIVVIQLTRSADFRTDIGIVSASDTTISVDVDLFSMGGSLIDSLQATLQPHGHTVLSDALGSDTADAYAVISTSTQGGQLSAWAEVIDTRTTSSIHIPGQLLSNAIFGDVLLVRNAQEMVAFRLPTGSTSSSRKGRGASTTAVVTSCGPPRMTASAMILIRSRLLSW